jgi:hypothetical protein
LRLPNIASMRVRIRPLDLIARVRDRAHRELHVLRTGGQHAIREHAQARTSTTTREQTGKRQHSGSLVRVNIITLCPPHRYTSPNRTSRSVALSPGRQAEDALSVATKMAWLVLVSALTGTAVDLNRVRRLRCICRRELLSPRPIDLQRDTNAATLAHLPIGNEGMLGGRASVRGCATSYQSDCSSNLAARTSAVAAGSAVPSNVTVTVAPAVV